MRRTLLCSLTSVGLPMRTVGLILLIVAAGLASLGGYLLAMQLPGMLEPSYARLERKAMGLERKTMRLERTPRSSDEQLAARVGGTGADSNTEAAKIKENKRLLEQLPKGNIVLDGPSTMKVGETRTVYANVGVDVSMETLRKRVRPGNQTYEAELAVSSKMMAELSGPGFKITSKTPEEQSVAEGVPTVWSWDVEAQDSGDLELEATLYAITNNRPQRINSYTHKMSVSVRPQTWSEWLKSRRDEIDTVRAIALTLGGGISGVAGWLVLYADRRRRKETPLRRRPTAHYRSPDRPRA